MQVQLQLIVLIAIAIIAGQWLSNRFLAPTPKEEVATRQSSGNSVQDFLDNY